MSTGKIILIWLAIGGVLFALFTAFGPHREVVGNVLVAPLGGLVGLFAGLRLWWGRQRDKRKRDR